jgi:nitrogen regulatory protein P-II 1
LSGVTFASDAIMQKANFFSMKKIEAIIRASKFEQVKEELSEQQINFFTFYEVKGYGHQKGESRSYRGAVYDVGYIARIKLEIIVSESFVEKAIATIGHAAHTGEKGDGLILVSDLTHLLNIRTGLTNGEAINS